MCVWKNESEKQTLRETECKEDREKNVQMSVGEGERKVKKRHLTLGGDFLILSRGVQFAAVV